MTDETIDVQGARIPALGFGTWQMNGRECEEGVRDALEIGYRQIDTAIGYENEVEVGAGLKASGVPREDVWLTTKIPTEEAEPRRLIRAAEASLRRLDSGYVDLLLLHWPNPDVPIEQTLSAMAEVRERGLVRQIGVSNFPAAMLGRALEVAPVFCDQVEYHPFLDQSRLLPVCREHDVLLTAYSPLARGRVPSDPTLIEIGQAHGKTAGQVALRWLLEQDRVSPIPKASSYERRVENWEVWNFELSPAERERIDALHEDHRTADPPWAPDWDD
jgi:diketogulonate reductase-like aldo/keto reductase